MPGSTIHTIVLVGPGGAGSSSLVRALAAVAGEFSPAEPLGDLPARAPAQPTGVQIVAEHPDRPGEPVPLVLHDTPGGTDAETRAALAGADVVAFVVSAEDGPEHTGRALWQQAADAGVPRLVVLSHVDRPGADFDAAQQRCRQAFGEELRVLFVPLPEQPPTGVLSLLSWTRYDEADGRYTASPAAAAEVAALMPQRNLLVEAILAATDDQELVDRYRDGRRVAYHQLVTHLVQAVQRDVLHPVVPVVASTGAGARPLLDLLVRLLPGQ